MFGMAGVAMSYTIGSLIGFIASIVVANRIRMPIFWKPLALTFFLPLSLSFVFVIFNVNYIVGIVTTITITYFLLLKLHVIEKTDGSFFIELMPNRISKPLITVVNKLEKIIDWFYG